MTGVIRGGGVWICLLCACSFPDPEQEVTSDTRDVVRGEVTGELPAVGMHVWDELGLPAISGCTLTLIGCRTALTAAHCICADESFGSACARENAGSHVFLDRGGFYPIEDAVVHPEYRRVNNRLVHDVAVIHLGESVSGIRPMPLDLSGIDPSEAIVVGYGRTAGTLSDYGVKRQGAADVIACQYPEIPTQHVCLSTELAQTCQGDSGGPLVSGTMEEPQLLGVTSYGYAPDGQPPCNGMAVDSRITASADFIAAQAGEDLGNNECDGELGMFVDDPMAVADMHDSELAPGKAEISVMEVPPGSSELRIGLNGEAFVWDGRADSPASWIDFNLEVVRLDSHGWPLYPAVCETVNPSSIDFCRVRSPDPGSYEIRVSNVGEISGTYQLTTTLFGDAPIAWDDVYQTVGPIKVSAAGGVLTNDEASSRGDLIAWLTVRPSNGYVELRKDGSFTYRPDDGFAGEDSFTYRAYDGSYSSNAVKVKIRVDAPPPDDDGDVNAQGTSETGGCSVATGQRGPGALLVLAWLAIVRRRRFRQST